MAMVDELLVLDVCGDWGRGDVVALMMGLSEG